MAMSGTRSPAASCNAIGSSRLSALAKSAIVGNVGAGTATVSTSSATPAIGSAATESESASLVVSAVAGSDGLSVHSSGSASWTPVYSVKSAVMPHGLGVRAARAYSGLYRVTGADPSASAAMLLLIFASARFDQSPWMQTSEVPAGFVKVQ